MISVDDLMIILRAYSMNLKSYDYTRFYIKKFLTQSFCEYDVDMLTNDYNSFEDFEHDFYASNIICILKIFLSNDLLTKDKKNQKKIKKIIRVLLKNSNKNNRTKLSYLLER